MCVHMCMYTICYIYMCMYLYMYMYFAIAYIVHRGFSHLCAEHLVFSKRIRGNLGLQQLGNTSQSRHHAPPTAPPTATPTRAIKHTITSETGSSFGDTYGDNSVLRRSSRKRVQRVMGYGENSSGLSSSSEVIKKKKRNKKRKRSRSGLSWDSEAQSEGSQTKKVCCGRASVSLEEERGENMVVDLEHLELGVSFRTEMDTLNKEESELVSVMQGFLEN